MNEPVKRRDSQAHAPDAPKPVWCTIHSTHYPANEQCFKCVEAMAAQIKMQVAENASRDPAPAESAAPTLVPGGEPASDLLGPPPPEVGVKHDADKIRWDLVQPLVVEEYIKVLTFGAKKYAPGNWRKVDNRRSRYFGAALRHIWAWWRGERNDAETGLHHLAHAMCNLAFLAEPELENGKRKTEID